MRVCDMRSSAAKKRSTLPNLIAGRYRVDGRLGQGGMAVVYKVRDISSDRHLALKQLIVDDDAERHKKDVELFEREFHTLTHLSHPRVIEVYDYGVDDTGPYYTMELLDGGDLRELSPADWRRACGLLLDVCSALSLLHSRRMVHRDVSPRNIRCTDDGLAKLIDFGAMIPMGPCKQVIGTAPFVAPEVINTQPLDARTDLYSLGATLYHTLTACHAYPAQDFSQIRDKWRVKPPPPSELVADIPEALDILVMSLIHLDPAARPVNAAEVMERLSAIAGLQIDDQLLVSQAYLSRPTLVGRDWAMTRLHRQMRRAQRGRGGTLMIQGASGVGRTRLIDACVLEAKLSGAIVLRADAGDAQEGEYAVVRAMLSQLLETAPEGALKALKPRVDVLGHVFPELLDKCLGATLRTFDDPRQIRPYVQTALREALFEVSHQRCLLVAVDDVHRIDEPSAAFVAFLSYEAANHPVVVCVSAQTDAPSTSEGALKLLSDVGANTELQNLTAEETEKLLGSVFGEVPNLQLIAYRLHAISKGNPRDVMQLAQHLVDRKLVRYQAGSWWLPDAIDAGDLPNSMAQALGARLDALSAEARLLAETMALSPEHNFSFEDCLLLSEHREASPLMCSLDELVAAEVLKLDKERYSLAQLGWVSALRADSDEGRARARHSRLVEMFEQHPQQGFRVAKHLLQAGEKERGLDVLIAYSEQSNELTVRDPEAYSRILQSLPSGWLEIYLDAIELCKKLKRPRSQLYSLQSRVSGFVPIIGKDETTCLRELIQQLCQDSGLRFYHELDDSMDSSARLKRALAQAQEHYDKSAPEDRVLEPAAAIRQLARLVIQATGVLITSCDISFWETLPSLKPLVPLSPALGVVQQIVHGLGNRITARYELACQEYRAIFERIAQPDRAGLDETLYQYTKSSISRGIAMVEAAMGLESSLEFVVELEKDPFFSTNALQIRMLYHLWQGDAEQAERCNQEMEVLQIQRSPVQLYEGFYLSRELTAHALADDLRGVKLVLNSVEKMADEYQAWVPTLHYARGEYQRIRGDYQGARRELKRALELVAPGRHQNWADIIGAYLKTLVGLESFEEAKELGAKALEAGEKAQLGYVCNYVKMPLALAEAKLGQEENAVRHSEAAIESFKQLGSTGINLGLAYETRARVAIYVKDPEGYQKYALLCAGQFAVKGSPALTAKYDKLDQEAQHPEQGVFTEEALSGGASPQSKRLLGHTVSKALTACSGAEERAQRSLELLIEHCGASEGLLYTIGDNGPVLSARVGRALWSADMDTRVGDYLAAELDGRRDVTMTGTDMSVSSTLVSAWTEGGGDGSRPVLLGHHAKEGFAITGLAVLLLEAGKQYRFPAELVPAISRFALDCGDVSACIVDG